MTTWSHTRLSTARECPKRYEFRYVLRAPQRGKSVESFVGTRVHAILERLYHHLAASGGEPPHPQAVREQYELEWDAEWRAREPFLVRGEPEEYRRFGWRCVENYWGAAYPFADWRTTVGIELDVRFAMGGVPFRAVLDRVEQDGDRWTVHDYKTSARPPVLAQVQLSAQLTRYALALRERYGAAPDAIELVYWHLPTGVPHRTRRTVNELDGEVRESVREVEAAVALKEYPARPSPLCRWCEYLDRCPEGRGARR